MSDVTVTIDLLDGPDVTIDLLDGPEVVLDVVGAPGPRGPAGAGFGSYPHTQAAAALVWTVQHNLGFKPAGHAIRRSSDGYDVDPASIVHVSDMLLLATFIEPTAGDGIFS